MRKAVQYLAAALRRCLLRPRRALRHAAHGLPLLGLCVAQAATAAPEAAAVDESRLKVALIYNFMRFIEWPANAFASADAPFTLCVFGTDPFGPALLELQKRSYNGRPIVIAYPHSGPEARDCRVLYVDDVRTLAAARHLVRTLADEPVLTVSSSGEVVDFGAGIVFVTQGNKLRWSLNLDATRRARLKVSAKLIEVAAAVMGETGR